jgi:hypothetical protein
VGHLRADPVRQVQPAQPAQILVHILVLALSGRPQRRIFRPESTDRLCGD